MFAETIVLVEGATEFFALPIYLKRIGFSLAENGIEIINCRGKDSIPLFWRLFTAFGYKCFFIFDGDKKTIENTRTFFGIITATEWETDPTQYVLTNQYAYFGADFETPWKDLPKEVKDTVLYGTNGEKYTFHYIPRRNILIHLSDFQNYYNTQSWHSH